MMLDETHDSTIRSWVDSANGHAEFPIQNLPLGVFSSCDARLGARLGVAIGDCIFDVQEASRAGLLSRIPLDPQSPASASALLGCHDARRALRQELFALLRHESKDRSRIEAAGLMHAREACRVHLPLQIPAYTDFFAGIHHAVNAGKQLRPDSPLLPNYKYVPIAYHSRASSVRVSGTPVHRPRGQRLPAGESQPRYEASQALDWELELGIWVGKSNELGTPVGIDDAGDHIAGFSLLNDWSARDIQRWEAQPLGPFLAKNFMTTISPWIVTTEAMEPYRCAMPPRPHGDPRPLPHLWSDSDQANGMIDIRMEVWLRTAQMRAAGAEPQRISFTSTLYLYWTPAQLIAHHTSNGCNLEVGDLFGSGTISPEDPRNAGCLLEMTQGGRNPIALSNGESRSYLQDGDEVILRGYCERAGFARIGFGEARGIVYGATSDSSY